MKISIKNASSEEIINVITNLNGCYGEYAYSKQLHTDLIADGAKYQYNKSENYHEFWKDIDKEYTLYRIYLK